MMEVVSFGKDDVAEREFNAHVLLVTEFVQGASTKSRCL